MIEKLITSALSGEGKGILEKLELPSNLQKPALDLAKDSLLGGIKNSFGTGNLSSLTEAFSGSGSNSLVNSITSDYAGSLISKLGINEGLSKTISETIIPMVFKFIGKKEDVPTNSIDDIKGLFGGGAGGAGKMLGGLLKKKLKF